MSHPTATHDWFAADNPDVLLAVVRPPAWPPPVVPPTPATLRRLQLFGCACARMVWELLPADARDAVLMRERFANGKATESDLRAFALRGGLRWGTTAAQYASDSARSAAGYHWDGGTDLSRNWDPAEAARSAAKCLATHAAGPAPPPRSGEDQWHSAWSRAFNEARAHQAELIRDIFPPPGEGPAPGRDWLTDTVLALARHADESGDYSALPILADALQDAGCNNELLLGRCRAASGVHCRGNWVVDLLLNRE